MRGPLAHARNILPLPERLAILLGSAIGALLSALVWGGLMWLVGKPWIAVAVVTGSITFAGLALCAAVAEGEKDDEDEA